MRWGWSPARSDTRRHSLCGRERRSLARSVELAKWPCLLGRWPARPSQSPHLRRPPSSRRPIPSRSRTSRQRTLRRCHSSTLPPSRRGSLRLRRLSRSIHSRLHLGIPRSMSSRGSPVRPRPALHSHSAAGCRQTPSWEPGRASRSPQPEPMRSIFCESFPALGSFSSA